MKQMISETTLPFTRKFCRNDLWIIPPKNGGGEAGGCKNIPHFILMLKIYYLEIWMTQTSICKSNGLGAN